MTRIPQFQRLLPVLIGLLILVVIGLLPVSLPTEDDSDMQAILQGNGVNATPPRPVGEIFAGVTVVQEFPATGTKISEAALVLATYQRANSGAIKVMMQTQVNGQWQTLSSQTVEKTKLQDNMPHTVAFDPPLVVKRGQIMRIVLQADGNEQNAITWWINPSDQRPGFALFYNGDPLPGTAQFQISYARASGRLVEMIGPLWTRMTVFLDPLWRAILAVGILLLFGSFLVLGRYLPGKALAFSQQSRPRLFPEIKEEAFSHIPSCPEKEAGELRDGRHSTERILPDPPD